MSLICRLSLLAGLALAPVAIAQQNDADAVQPAQQPQPLPQPQPQPSTQSPVVFKQANPRATTPAQNLPPFESMVVRGPDGKVKRLESQLDILAIHRNTLIGDETKEKIRPIIREWFLDLDQLVIDNLDFLEKIEPPDGSPGVIARIDLNDATTVQPVAQMMNQLIAAGPLTQHLQTKGAFTREQADQNQRIVSDYLQQVMNEVLAENQVPAAQGNEPQNQEERNKQVNTVSGYLYALSARDAIASYHRQLQDAAPFADQIVAATDIPEDVAAKLQSLVADAKKAQTDLDRRRTVRLILNELNFDQRREFLQRAKEIVPERDPLDAKAS